MNKRGFILKLLGIIFLVILIIIGSAFYYFYNVYVFKSIRVCVDGVNDMRVNCTSDDFCRSLFKVNEARDYLLEKKAPYVIMTNFEKIAKKAVFCEGTCKVRTVRGFDFQSMQIKSVDKCDDDEEEILINIKGKDLFGTMKFLKNVKGE